MLDFLSTPFAAILRWFNSWTHHYLVALLLFALLIKIILIPFGIKQQKTQIKGAKLRPKLALIEKKYAGRTDQRTMQKKQQEIMQLQQEEGYSPLSGCLPMILQLALILVLYQIVQNPLTHIVQCSGDVLQALQAAAKEVKGIAADSTATVSQLEILSFLRSGAIENAAIDISSLPSFSLFGLDFAQTPTWSNWLWFLPFLVFGAQFASMKLTRLFSGANPMQGAQNQTRESKISAWIMDFTMPLMSLFFAFNFSATLGVYWIYQSGLGVLQSFILAKAMPLPTFTEEEIKEYERAMKGKKTHNEENRGRVRSLHHIDDEDYEDLPAAKSAPQQNAGKTKIAPAPLKEEETPAPTETESTPSEQDTVDPPEM